MNSCVYNGSVRHRRFSPVPHEFEYELFMMYLDLAELPHALDGRLLWSARRPALAWWRRGDYLGDGGIPLEKAVRDEAERQSGVRPKGPIRMLTHLRYLGWVMNPVTLYYCFAPGGESLEAILAEITNTPWGERHTYVLSAESNEGSDRDHHHRLRKAFHVSPFMPMNQDYRWRFTKPGAALTVHMESRQSNARVFDASLRMRREPLTGATLARVLLRFPLMTARVVGGIYWQAARLRFKKAPYYPHPARPVP